MQVLSIDVGYGHTKCMFKGETFKFPTAISHAGIGATNFVATDAYEFEGNRYFVGDSKAVRDGLPTSDFSFLKKYAPLLVYKAIEISAEKYGLDLTKEITVATGLSVLQEFKDARWEVLVTTDLAARGIDIAKLPTVLNYDLPRSATDYIHRMGRTGRAGEKAML